MRASGFRSVSLPSRGAFHLSLTVLVHYRSLRSIQAWRVVPPCSDRVSRAPPYSRTLLRHTPTGLSPAPAGLPRPFGLTRQGHWPAPLSLAATRGISRVPIERVRREPLLMSVPPGTEMFQFPGFAPPAYGFSQRYPSRGGLPHSETHGSTPARGSPWLFAACHVLRRLLAPRHPPNALVLLQIAPTTAHTQDQAAPHDAGPA